LNEYQGIATSPVTVRRIVGTRKATAWITALRTPNAAASRMKKRITRAKTVTERVVLVPQDGYQLNPGGTGRQASRAFSRRND